jgi:hypothetical protein
MFEALKALLLIQALHDNPESGAIFRQGGKMIREKVLLAPKTLEQLKKAMDLLDS